MGEGGSSGRPVRNIRAGLGCLGNGVVLNKVMEHWSSKWDPMEQGGIYSIECLPSFVEQESCAGLGGGKPWKSWNWMEWNEDMREEERRIKLKIESDRI